MTTTKMQIEGRWNEVKGIVKEKWGAITDNDLTQVDGNVDRLIGLVQRKTGEGREAIEHFLEETLAGSGSFLEQVTDTVRDYADTAGRQVTDTYEHVADSVKHGYEQAEQYVERNPTQSVAVAFGGGVLAGLIVGLVLRSR